jgi:hypothetical protein
MIDIEACPKCKKCNGWIWHWGSFNGEKEGHSECTSCGAKFK